MLLLAEKRKIMTFLVKDPFRRNIYISNKILEQVNTFSYLGCIVLY